MSKFYVGRREATAKLEMFVSDEPPTFGSHGCVFMYVIGPFRTKRGAAYMAKYGNNNPHCRCVADAEKLAAEQERAIKGMADQDVESGHGH